MEAKKELEVEPDPEFEIEFSVRIDTEWLGNVHDFQALRPIEVHGEPEEEKLESESDRADGLRFSQHWIAKAFIIDIIDFSRVSFEFGSRHIDEEYPPDGADLSDDRVCRIHKRDPELQIRIPSCVSNDIVIIRRADLVVTTPVEDVGSPSHAGHDVDPEGEKRVSSDGKIFPQVDLGRRVADEFFADRNGLGEAEREGMTRVRSIIPEIRCLADQRAADGKRISVQKIAVQLAGLTQALIDVGIVKIFFIIEEAQSDLPSVISVERVISIDGGPHHGPGCHCVSVGKKLVKVRIEIAVRRVVIDRVLECIDRELESSFQVCIGKKIGTEASHLIGEQAEIVVSQHVRERQGRASVDRSVR